MKEKLKYAAKGPDIFIHSWVDVAKQVDKVKGILAQGKDSISKVEEKIDFFDVFSEHIVSTAACKREINYYFTFCLFLTAYSDKTGDVTQYKAEWQLLCPDHLQAKLARFYSMSQAYQLMLEREHENGYKYYKVVIVDFDFKELDKARHITISCIHNIE